MAGKINKGDGGVRCRCAGEKRILVGLYFIMEGSGVLLIYFKLGKDMTIFML